MASGVGERLRMGEEGSKVSLPEELLLHIFSYLTSTELVSTVYLVSKRWHLLGKSSLAILRYRFISSSQKHEFLKFVNHIEVESSIPVRVMKLQLSLRLQEKISTDEILTHLMKSLTNLKFSELFLQSLNINTLSLVLKNSNFLSVIHLIHCQFPNQHFASVPTLSSLHQLLLDDVVIQHSHNFFFNLSQKCPYIAELTLTNCTGCEYIHLTCNNLKKVRVHYTFSKYNLSYSYSKLYKLQKIKIEAQNLERFHLHYNGNNQIDLDIDQCRQLHFLHLHCENFPRGFPATNIFSIFPHLNTLFICLNSLLNDPLYMVSDQLETLTIWNKHDLLIPVHICTPNLRAFNYAGGGIIEDFAPMDASKIGETQIELSSSKTSNVDWFLKLRSYIAKFNKDAALCLSIYEMAWFNLHNIQHLGIHSPCSINKLKLHICPSLPQKRCKSLLDALLWTFRPKILEFDSDINFKLILLKELDHIVTEQDCCKPTLAHRCWRHFLKDFKIVRSTKIDQQKYFTIIFTW